LILTVEVECYTIAQSNQSSTDGKGGLDEGAKAVVELWGDPIGSYISNFVRFSGSRAAAEVDRGKSQRIIRDAHGGRQTGTEV